MTALRKYLMGKLVHYIKKGAGQLRAESTPTDMDVVLDPVEENGENQFETKSVKVEDDEEEMVTVDASGEVMEEEEEMDTEKLAAATLELVGQMEIEISDQDAGGTELVSTKTEDTAAISEPPLASSTISSTSIITTTTTTLTSSIEPVTAASDDGVKKQVNTCLCLLRSILVSLSIYSRLFLVEEGIKGDAILLFYLIASTFLLSLLSDLSQILL